MNPCCEHLLKRGREELAAKDKRIAFLESECTRLFEPTKEFWNKTEKSQLIEEVRELAAWLNSSAITLDAIAENGDGEYGIIKATLKEYASGSAKITREALTKHKEILKQLGVTI